MEIKVAKEVELFVASLEKQSIAKVLRTVDLLEHFGNKLGMPHMFYCMVLLRNLGKLPSEKLKQQ